MTADFATWSEEVKRLLHALDALGPQAAAVNVPPQAGREWYELLRHKLLPQLDARPPLVVGVVGGTNIGKSLVFNHLAGEVASTVSPLAAGTRHPVCLAPPGAADADLLARWFDAFELLPWHSPDDPLSTDSRNLLFWRQGRNIPARLLVLDTPDVDSDAMANWQRARAVRQAADVLIAVLTQQKYNDAAVKQFFREAVKADKQILVLFNQCDLAADRPYWPQWLETFSRETGARPELVYVVPFDREAAGKLQLPFYEVGRDGQTLPEQSSSLRDDLAALHFDAVKIRTFRGAMRRVLDRGQGARAYLDEVRRQSGEFSAAAAALSAAEMARVAWPTLPARILVDAIRDWWDAGRSRFTRQIHGFYRTLGRGLTWPARAAWQAISPTAVDPLADFQSREREAVVQAVEKMLGELDRLARVGNQILQPRLLAMLGGEPRESLLGRVQAAHAALPALDDDYRAFLRTELETWKGANPRAVALLRSLDYVAALARPAITVTLAISGWIVAGDLVSHAAVEAAQQTASHLATETAIAGGIAGGGEALVSGTSQGVGQAAAVLFLRLQSRYAQQRAAWLAQWLERELLGSLLGQLRSGAEVARSLEFRAVAETLDRIEAVGRD